MKYLPIPHRLLWSGLLGLLVLPLGASTLPCGNAATRQAAASYTSAAGERLDACFDLAHDTVTLRLPRGDTLTLPATVSGSGARYQKGSSVFWEHQGAGRYFVGEKLLFEGRLRETP